MDYEPAWDLQRRIQAELIESKRRDPGGERQHTLLLVEHPPVYTLGKNGKREHLLLTEQELVERGAKYYHIERGGDITFHGPGQLVGYPILDLHRFRTDLGWYLRSLEETVIRTCADYGVSALRSPVGTGVWVGPPGSERKICAFGIRCSRWVTMHGFAFNLNTDLRWFDLMVPCGIRDRGVTSLATEVGSAVDEPEARERWVRHFEEVFHATLHPSGFEPDSPMRHGLIPDPGESS